MHIVMRAAQTACGEALRLGHIKRKRAFICASRGVRMQLSFNINHFNHTEKAPQREPSCGAAQWTV